MKLIVFLRNLVKRVIFYYYYEVRLGIEYLSLKEVLVIEEICL